VLVILFATTRYPNELIRLAKLVRRLDLRLIVVSDSRGCPVNQFAQLTIIARYLHFPLVGSPSSMACLINCLISEMAARERTAIREHQEALEHAYLENDILFNMEGRTSLQPG
jgi:DNA-binding MurR/RpiR family transcriptional regulator